MIALEKKAIKQFQKLTSIKPDQEWVKRVKMEILSEGGDFSLTEGRLSLWQRLIEVLGSPLQRPVLAVVPLVLLAAVLGGMAVYFNFFPSDIPVITTVISQPSSQETLTSLKQLEVSLKEVNERLERLNKAADPGYVLSVAQAAEISAQQGKKLVARIARANKKLNKRVLTSLNGLFDEVEKKAANIQKQRVEQIFKSLNQAQLNQTEKDLFAMAQQYYKAGKYIDALLILQRVENLMGR